MQAWPAGPELLVASLVLDERSFEKSKLSKSFVGKISSDGETFCIDLEMVEEYIPVEINGS